MRMKMNANNAKKTMSSMNINVTSLGKLGVMRPSLDVFPSIVKTNVLIVQMVKSVLFRIQES